jgi:hypothetical protein
VSCLSPGRRGPCMQTLPLSAQRWNPIPGRIAPATRPCEQVSTHRPVPTATQVWGAEGAASLLTTYIVHMSSGTGPYKYVSSRQTSAAKQVQLSRVQPAHFDRRAQAWASASKRVEDRLCSRRIQPRGHQHQQVVVTGGRVRLLGGMYRLAAIVPEAGLVPT